MSKPIAQSKVMLGFAAFIIVFAVIASFGFARMLPESESAPPVRSEAADDAPAAQPPTWGDGEDAGDDGGWGSSALAAARDGSGSAGSSRSSGGAAFGDYKPSAELEAGGRSGSRSNSAARYGGRRVISAQEAKGLLQRRPDGTVVIPVQPRVVD